MWRDRRRVHQLRLVGLLSMAAACGCSSPATQNSPLLRLDIDRADPRPHLTYYFGGLVSADASDPFEAGIISETEGSFFVDTTALYAHVEGDYRLSDADRDGVLTWEELEPFLQQSYYEERGIPQHFDSLRYARVSESHFALSVDGVMTSARRHIRVPLRALNEALSGYVERGDRVIYPRGTVITADHEWEGRVAERTVMIKRGDGHWDYAAYDSSGARIRSTLTPPKPLTVPTQCVGCHLGTRLYEPEKSFPGAARAGPSGPRKVHWNTPLPNPELVAFFDEHRKRSDGILGIYGTLHVFELITRREAGSLDDDDLRLLESLGL